MTGHITPLEKVFGKATGDKGVFKYDLYNFKKKINEGIPAPAASDTPAAPVAPENDQAAKDAADEEARKQRMRGRGVFDTLSTAGGYAGDTSQATTAAKTLLGT